MSSKKLQKNTIAFVISLVVLILIGPFTFKNNILPITLQTFILVLIGYWCGWSAVAATIAYVIIGLVGYPVFSGYISNPKILSTTSAGFVTGFPVMVATVHLLKDKLTPFLNAFVIFCSAHVVLILFAFIYNTIVGLDFIPIRYIWMTLLPSLLVKSGLATVVVILFNHWFHPK